jgi:putative hydrolase of the HAD superfamily
MKLTIFFDLDGTLYSYKDGHDAGLHGAYDYWSKITDDDFDQFYEKYKQSRKNVKRFLKGTVGSHSRVLYFQGMVEKDFESSQPYHIAELTQRYWDTFIDSIEPFEGVETALSLLLEKGYQLAIITNMDAEIQFRKLHKLNLDNYFTAVITSEEAGEEKPHPHIFLHSRDRLKVNAEDCIMIGDNWEHDVEVAEYIGMRGIHVTIEEEPRENTTRLNNYSELVRIIDEMIADPIEGVIKYKLDHRDSEMHVSLTETDPLIQLRDKLWELNLIGVYPPDHALTPNIGFGNASVRYTDNGQFIISGSQTGEKKDTSIDDYALVLDYDIENNRVISKGITKPSSESMTHAAIYSIAPEVKYVIHVHHKELWENYRKLEMSTTPEDAPYGTPEMAKAIQEAYKSQPKLNAPVCLLGHIEGLLTWGETKEEALELFLEALKKLRNYHS